MYNRAFWLVAKQKFHLRRKKCVKFTSAERVRGPHLAVIAPENFENEKKKLTSFYPYLVETSN